MSARQDIEVFPNLHFSIFIPLELTLASTYLMYVNSESYATRYKGVSKK